MSKTPAVLAASILIAWVLTAGPFMAHPQEAGPSPAAVGGVVLVGMMKSDDAGPETGAAIVTSDMSKTLAQFRASLSTAILRPDASVVGKQAALAGITVYRVEVENPDDAPALIKALQATPGVEFAEPDYLFALTAAPPPDDPEFPKQWYLNNTGQYFLLGADIAILDAWDYDTGSSHPLIAVIDTGVDMTHPDLANQLWSNPQESPGDANGDGRPGFAGFDDDGDGLVDEDSAGRQPGEPGYTNNLVADDDENGYADDLRGWNWIDDNANPQDIMGHGTHVSGILGAETNNAVGIAGVCPQARIMPLKVFQVNGTAATSDIVLAIDYARKKGAKVVNMSFGGPQSTAMQLALESAYTNAVLVASAGNDGPGAAAAYPAAFTFVIGVGATDVVFNKDKGIYEEQIAPFTTVASADVCAPGVNIRSTFPGGGYTAWSGTSMAAPVVSGIAGLLISEKTGGFWGPTLYQGQLEKASSKKVSLEYLASENGAMVTKTATRARMSALEVLNVEPAPILSVARVVVQDPDGDDDGRADAGETVELVVTLRNGYGNAENVTARLTSADALATILDDSSNYGSIGPQGTETNAGDPLRVAISPDATNNRIIRFQLEATASNGGASGQLTVDLRIQRGTTLDPFITADKTLKGGTEYIVPGSLTIPAGLTLTIEPGVTLLMDPEAQIGVYGTLVAIGTAQQPIVFTAGGDEPWGGIFIDGAPKTNLDGFGNYVSGSALIHCIVEHIATPMSSPPAYPYAPIHLRNIDPLLMRSCVFRDNGGWFSGGICTDMDVTAKLENCIFANNQGDYSAALQVANPLSTASVKGCVFYKNSGGCIFVHYRGASVDQCVFLDNRGDLNGETPDIIALSQYAGVTSFNDNVILQDPISGGTLVGAMNGTAGTLDFRRNYWGPATTAEINAKGGNANISSISDIWDEAGAPRINYADWKTTPPILSNLPPYLVNIDVDKKLGLGRHDVALTFNRDMNTTYTPTVTFGPAEPYTQKLVTNGRWTGPRSWRGEIYIDVFTGDGVQRLRVANALDLAGNSSFPDTRTRFEIDSIGLQGLMLQASPEAGHVALTIIPVDVPDLAGYNVYRATTATGTYTKLNSAIVVDPSYKDYSAPEGLTRYYKVAAVRTDFKESEKSDPASAAALDGTPPVITHTPVTGPIQLPAPGVTIQATVTDNVGVASVTLYWKRSTESEFQARIMQHPSGNLWSANLSGEELAAPGVEYYIVATDAMGNAIGSGGATTPHVIAVVDPVNQPPSALVARPVLHIRISEPATDPEAGVVRYRYVWTSSGGDAAVTHGPTTSLEDELREDVDSVTFDEGETWTLVVTPLDNADAEGPASEARFVIGAGGSVRFEGWIVE